MRLKQETVAHIRCAITSVLPDADVYLFGSRVDDTERGGDIDFMVLGTRELTWQEKADIKRTIESLIGEQRIDIISYTHDASDPFKAVALTEAVKL